MSRFENREVRFKALAMKVLAVAIQGGLGSDWAAYVDAVKGESHSKEWMKVAEEGTKLRYNIAKVLFPDFDEKYKWRA